MGRPPYPVSVLRKRFVRKAVKIVKANSVNVLCILSTSSDPDVDNDTIIGKW